MTKLEEKYPWIRFHKIWENNTEVMFLLGQCEAYIKSLSNTPILPEDYQELLRVSLIKGVQATIAIEGNTLTDIEIAQIEKGENLPFEKKYLEIEAKNIIDALNSIRNDVLQKGKEQYINTDLIKYFHSKIGSNLGGHFKATPGQFASSQRVVGGYRTPDPNDVEELITNMCQWLKEQFNYPKNIDYSNTIIQAIVTHIFIEWIHPFDDGNGRTGRLLEFYILLRGGLSDIFAHILTNHYNETRAEYYNSLKLSTQNKSLTLFITYALKGLITGLELQSKQIQESQKKILWKKYVHDEFEKLNIQQKVKDRMKSIPMDIDINKIYFFDELPDISTKVAKYYGFNHKQTLKRDMDKLIELELIEKDDKGYSAKIKVLSGYMPKRKLNKLISK